jgi:hypothetical protein
MNKAILGILNSCLMTAGNVESIVVLGDGFVTT